MWKKSIRHAQWHQRRRLAQQRVHLTRPSSPKIFTLVMAWIAIKMTQITSATELHNRIPVSRLTPSPIGCEVVVLMSEADRLPWRCAPLWHFNRMAHSKMKQSIGYGRSSSDQNQQSVITTRTRTRLLKDDEPGGWWQDGLLDEFWKDAKAAWQ